MQRLQQILIIDDDERNIFALKAVLTGRKFSCITASGGLQALEILRKQTDIAVALIDMMMPGMDGYELMSTIRESRQLDKILLVAVTAQAMPGDREKCMQAGADAYISKPINTDLLMDILNSGAITGNDRNV